MIILNIGFSILKFYHLVTHAIFKSLLFLCTGIVIHLMKNNQDIRCCGGLREIISFVRVIFYPGCPFLTEFYSKDLVIEFSYIFKN